MTKFKQWLAWTWDGFAEHKSDLSSTAKGGQIQIINSNELEVGLLSLSLTWVAQQSMTKFKQWLAWTWDRFAKHKTDLSSITKCGQI
jgi:hypothetical protein